MRTINRRLRTLGAALAISIAVFAGSASAQTEITFWHIFDAGPAAEFIDGVINDFNAANPDIKVTHLGTNFWDYWTRLTTATAGGISGWEWRAGGPAGITGPKGIRLGAAGSDVLAKYRADDIFSVWDDPTSISAFAGDTTDITFRLDSAGKVSAMEAGWGCDPAR
mgnify:CR=1 FL=1